MTTVTKNYMTNIDLKHEVALKTNMTKQQSEQAVKAVLDTLTEGLAEGKKIILIGFGALEVRKRAARIGRNPQTGEPIQIAASKTVGFKAGKTLKDAVSD